MGKHWRIKHIAPPFHLRRCYEARTATTAPRKRTNQARGGADKWRQKGCPRGPGRSSFRISCESQPSNGCKNARRICGCFGCGFDFHDSLTCVVWPPCFTACGSSSLSVDAWLQCVRQKNTVCVNTDHEWLPWLKYLGNTCDDLFFHFFRWFHPKACM